MKKIAQIQLFAGLFLASILSSCQYYQATTFNPLAYDMAPTFQDTALTYTNSSDSSLVFNLISTTRWDNEFIYFKVTWQFDEAGGNMRLWFDISAPSKDDNPLESKYTIIETSLLTDLSSNQSDANMWGTFKIERLDTTTTSYTYLNYQLDILPSYTTQFHTYSNVYRCTKIVPSAGTSNMKPDIIYFHKGTGLISFHDMASNRNWDLNH